MSAELKPCPFCGGDKHMVLPPNCTKSGNYNPGDNAQPVVRCMTCYAEAMGSSWDYTKETAIAAWNRRTDMTPPAADYVADYEPQSFIEDDGCPTENAVLKRFWREHQALAARPASPDTRVDVETLAAALWREESVNAGAPTSVAAGRTIASFADQSPELRSRWVKFASCAIRHIGGQDRG